MKRRAGKFKFKMQEKRNKRQLEDLMATKAKVNPIPGKIAVIRDELHQEAEIGLDEAVF